MQSCHTSSTAHTMSWSVTFSLVFQQSPTHTVMESVAVPIPCVKQLHSGTRILGPCVTIRDWRVKTKDHNAESEEDNSASLSNHWAFAQAHATDPSGDKVVHLTKRNNGKVKGREVVVQEELSLHEEKWEIMESPSKHCRANLVIETLELDVAVIAVTSLPSEHGQALEKDVKADGGSRAPPDEWISNQINLAVVFAPEVDTTAEHRPRWRT